MAFGFRVENQFGNIQIDSDFVCARLIASGSVLATSVLWSNLYRLQLHLPGVYDVSGLIVLLKPSQFGKWIGAYEAWSSRQTFGAVGAPSLAGTAPGTVITALAQCSFDYAVFSMEASPVQTSGAYGLRVLTGSGAVAYTSEYSYPTLDPVIQLSPWWSNNPSDYPGPAASSYPITVGYSGYSTMPWLLANALIMTQVGIGEGDSVGCLCAQVISLTSLQVDLRDASFYLPQLRDPNYDPYAPWYVDGSSNWTPIHYHIALSNFNG